MTESDRRVRSLEGSMFLSSTGARLDDRSWSTSYKSQSLTSMSVLEQQKQDENSPTDEGLYADPNADPHVGLGPGAPTAKYSDGTTSMSQNTSHSLLLPHKQC